MNAIQISGFRVCLMHFLLILTCREKADKNVKKESLHTLLESASSRYLYVAQTTWS